MKITSENIKGDDCRVVKGVNPEDTLKRIGSAWLALRESGKIEDCDCKRILTLPEAEKINVTKNGYRCKYILRKDCLGQKVYQFAVWIADSFASFCLYDQFGQCVEIVNGTVTRNEDNVKFDLIEQSNGSTACDLCEIDFLIQEGFEIEEPGE